MKKNTLLYLLALVGCFLLGCAVSLGLSIWDSQTIKPMKGGQVWDLSSFGFTLRVPEDAVLGDHSRENAELGGNALYAGSASGRVQVRVRSLLRAWPSMACAALAPSSRRSMSCIFISMRL